MKVSFPKSAVPIYHKACNGIAFYTEGKFQVGEAIRASRVFFLDGSQPVAGESCSVACGSCKERIGSLGFGSLEYRGQA